MSHHREDRDDEGAWEGVLPRPGTRGAARRRPRATIAEAFAAPATRTGGTKKPRASSPAGTNATATATGSALSPRATKATTKHTGGVVFPALERRDDGFLSPSAWPTATHRPSPSLPAQQRQSRVMDGDGPGVDEEIHREDAAVTQRALLERLHTSGIQRSHVEPPRTPGSTNQRDVKEGGATTIPSRRPPRPTAAPGTSRHVMPPPTCPLVRDAAVTALHPTADGVLFPTRPVTSTSVGPRPSRRLVVAASSAAEATAIDPSAVDNNRPTSRRVPLTARDRFYINQRASTAPGYTNGDPTPRSKHRTDAIPPSGNRRDPPSSTASPVESGDDGGDPLRRSELLAANRDYQTFTEGIAEHLSRAAEEEQSRVRNTSRSVQKADQHVLAMAHDEKSRNAGTVARDSFLYLRRIDSNPYHLVVTDHTKINPNDYYTVSRLGVTHFAHNSSEFQALERFERDNYIYSLIVKLPFFRRYRLWKRFTLWKHALNLRKRSTAFRSLNQNLFVLLPHLHDALLRLRAACLDIGRTRLFEFDGVSGSSQSNVGRPGVPVTNSGSHQGKTYTLGEFSIRLKAQKMECERLIDNFIAEAVMIAKHSCEQYLFAFLENTGFNGTTQETSASQRKPHPASTGGNRIGAAAPARENSSRPKAATDLLETEQGMTYTERATMRTQCRKITKFLRVVEFLISDALLQVAITSTQHLYHEMMIIRDGKPPVQSGSVTSSGTSASQAAVNAAIMARYKHTPLFRIEIALWEEMLFQSSGSSTYTKSECERPPSITDRLEFTPAHEHLRSQIEMLVFNGLKAVTHRDRLLSNPIFKIYLDTSQDEGIGTEDDDDGENENNGDVSNEGMDLDILIMEDSVFVETLQGINAIVEEAYTRADAACTSIVPFLDKHQANLRFCEQINDPSLLYGADLDNVRELLHQYTEEISQFNALSDSLPCGLLLLDHSKLNASLKPSPRRCLVRLHQLIPMVVQFKNAQLLEELTKYNDRISSIPTSVDEYAETLAFLRDLQEQVDFVDEQYASLKGLYQLVEDYSITISDVDQTNAFLLSQKRAQLRTSMDLFESSVEQYTEKFGIELEARVPALVSQFSELVEALRHPEITSLSSDPKTMVEYLRGVENRLHDLQSVVERHFFLERTLSLPITTALDELAEVENDLVLKVELWNGMYTWNQLTQAWDALVFPAEVDLQAITNQVVAMYTKVVALQQQADPSVVSICVHLKTQVESYRITLPVLSDLRCPCLEERHYAELQGLLGFSIRPGDLNVSDRSSPTLLTLGYLVGLKLAPRASQVNRVTSDAIQERALKESLEKVIAVWEFVEFDVRSYKDTKDYYILVSFESIYATLEESLVNLTSLLNSRYIAPIKEIALVWQKRLALFQETLDAWIECQRKWMHLESIFSAPDIQKQLPSESQSFATVNQYWKDLMRRTRDYRNCMRAAGAFVGHGLAALNAMASSSYAATSSSNVPPTNVHASQVSLLETLSRHNAALDKLEKSLEDYLETKRRCFPRFYFLSNDELLEILAHAKEPQCVQRHLCKCFDALVHLEISDDSHSVLTTLTAATAAVAGHASTTSGSAPDILAMISPEGERVAFTRSLKARGHVEDWLQTVLVNMRVTLHRHLKACLLDYQHASRESWLFRHPAQCIAVVVAITWARECEICFRSPGDPIQGLRIWFQTICSQLSHLTRLVRTPLTKVQRKLVVSLVTTDVHSRDVVEDLILKRVTSVNDFLWAQQLRYYWSPEHDECVAQQAHCRIPYGYEYMGACSRLVITPLTDRCWMTITGALAMSFGAAPSGPAGTGKTETSKDLAKALGTLCIVFNCSDQIDTKMMAKILNGAVQSGSWACLDEFNRIDIEVLSVVAQQMTTLRHARLCGASDVVLDGHRIPMHNDHHIIITMNPGYVGRTELPDNLKVCFRPVAMMVPDYALIAEILLFAEGFQHAKHLAKKVTKLYKLCSEQLSQQPHYDFGMRAVKSVLLLAGAIKRGSQSVTTSTVSGGSVIAVAITASSEQDESNTVIRAMQDANLPKLLDDDGRLFQGILRDLFPEVWDEGEYTCSTSSGLGSLDEEIDRQIRQQGYTHTSRWKRKILDLFATLEVRIGIVQIGTAGSGKSVALRILRDALTSLRETRHHPDTRRFQRVISFILNPKSIAMHELYGFFHPMTREWTDGLASKILRQCITEKSEWIAASASMNKTSEGSDNSGPFYWICFDGPIDVLWIESMNTVLDDNMTLCLANGERIKLLPRIQLLFEVGDTSAASPATISRLGVIYYHQSLLTWRPLVESWLQGVSIPGPKDPSGSPGPCYRLQPRLQARLMRCFDVFIDPGLAFVIQGDKFAVSSSASAFVSSLCSIYENTLLQRASAAVYQLLAEPLPPPTSTSAAATASAAALEVQQFRCLDMLFLFSFVWSFGGNLQVDRWKSQFQEFLSGILSTPAAHFVSRDFVGGKLDGQWFDVVPDFETMSFSAWDSPRTSTCIDATSFAFHADMPLFQVLVPTTDVIKYTYLTRLLALDGGLPVFLTGATGSGKSVLIQQLLKSKEDLGKTKKNVLPVVLNFSAQTSSLVTQHSIENKLVKKRKTHLGAPMDSMVVVFIDDINMPSVEVHGAQPPIELLRQWLEYRGMYDREKFFWKEISDTVLIVAGGLPGGGRNTVCSRFVRQFRACFCLPSSDTDAMRSIFGAIIRTHIKARGLTTKAVQDTLYQIADNSIALYREVCKNLLPTPSKCHYLFNLRDLTKIMQGLVLGIRWYSEREVAMEIIVRLWAHECIRVFRDRLTEEGDKRWLSDQLLILANRNLGVSWNVDHILPGAIKSTRRASVGGVGASRPVPSHPPLFVPKQCSGVGCMQPYEEVTDLDEFEAKLEGIMAQYNAINASRTKIVFFREALIHVAAISRILIQPRGHALLLGLAGSGKRSLARIAVFMIGYRCYEIELTKNFGLSEFRETLKAMMVAAVLGEQSDGASSNTPTTDIRPTVLLLNESQLVSDLFLEDINTLLNGGEIPNLFSVEEYEKIMSDVRSLRTQHRLLQTATDTLPEVSSGPSDLTKKDCEAYFEQAVQQAVHIVICHAHNTAAFRCRVRQFPSLVNCTTIDFFDAWPGPALQYVAGRFLGSSEFGMPASQNQTAEVNSTAKKNCPPIASVQLPAATRQAVALLCMEIHQSVITRSQDFLAKCQRHVYFTPKHYVDLIALFLNVLKEKQEALEATLMRLSVGVIKLEETNALVATLQEELVALQPILHSKTIEAEQLLEQVGIDQNEAARVASRVAQDETRVKQQQQDVAACQADAQKDLDQALPALNAAVAALDSLDKKDITEVKAFIKPPQAVQVVMEAVCIMLGEKPDWDTSKRVLSRTTFMNELKDYDKDNINPVVLKRIRKYIENPEFAVDEVRKVSKAAMSLCMWVHAIDTYARIFKDVAPKRQRLSEMNGVLAVANQKLESKQQELASVMDKVQVLKDQCDRTLAEKQRLVRESELTQARLERAERLTVGLEDERIRWKESIELLRQQGQATLGDAFLSAAAIMYLGPFTGSFRSQIIGHWTSFASRLVDISMPFSVIDSYGDTMKLREWELLGLPSDTVSMENAVFVMQGTQQRWPLLIDPQQQATQWIKRAESSQHLRHVQANDRELVQVVEECLAGGHPLLIEEVTEQAIEPALEHVLMKAFVPMPQRTGSVMQVRLGDRVVDAKVDSFRLYLVSQIANPHFIPDVFIRMNVINFTVTSDGLAAQLLSDVVRRERIDVEERKHKLLMSITQDQKLLQEIEIKILSLLSESKGNILDDVELIKALETAKRTSRVVTQRLAESEATKHQLQEIRDQYHVVARRGALLFFVIADLPKLDAMYQNSLDYFQRLFISSLEEAPMSSELEKRLQYLLDHLTLVVYRNIARGLFEAHKLLFSLLIAIRILITEEIITNDDIRLLDTAAATASAGLMHPAQNTGSRRTLLGTSTRRSMSYSSSDLDPMEILLNLSCEVPAFGRIMDSYREEPSMWTEWLTCDDPYAAALPGDGCDAGLSNFQRLILVRWLREDAWTAALRHFVTDALGEPFVEGAAEARDSIGQMEALFADMDKSTPCLFLLSSGADPISLLTQFAQARQMYPDKYFAISLGQGQGPVAERMLQNCSSSGYWLVLQNVHLAKSWLPRFQELLALSNKIENRHDLHDDYRLFLTSFPVAYFPITILQQSVKVTNEPPKGIKANLQRTMGLLRRGEGDQAEQLLSDAGSEGYDAWLCQTDLQLVFGLSFFHAVIQERTKFGSLGWNLKYDFSDADFLSVVTLQRRLLVDMIRDRRRAAQRQRKEDEENGHAAQDESADELDDELTLNDVPWDALHFLTGEIFYGGRVTDEFDRRCLMSNLQRFCSLVTTTMGTMEPTISTSTMSSFPLFTVTDGSFTAPLFRDREAMYTFVDQLPPTMDSPFVFGMHPNANVFYLKQETQRILSLLVQLQSQQQQQQHNGDEDEDEEDDDDDHNSEANEADNNDDRRRRVDSLSTTLQGHRRSSPLGSADQRRLSKGRSSPANESTAEFTALQLARDILQQLPRPETLETPPPSPAAVGAADDASAVPLHVVKLQEIAKTSALLVTVHNGLTELQNAIHGLVAMSSSLEAILQSLSQHQVPLEWRKRDGASVLTPTSTQSLAQWVTHVRFRTEFLQQWQSLGHAPQGVYPLSAFFFPQGFFTALLQRHARKYVVPIHHLEFQFQVQRESFQPHRKQGLHRTASTRAQSISEFDPEIVASGAAVTGGSRKASSTAMAATLEAMDGAFVSGLYLEGAQWSDERQCLTDPVPGVMHHPMPVIHVIPQVIAAPSAVGEASGAAPTTGRTKALTPSYLTLKTATVVNLNALEGGGGPESSASAKRSAMRRGPRGPHRATSGAQGKYVCPLYKTRARKGTLSTMGVSTNFVLAMELVCERPPDHYALNGTALICNLSM